MKYKNADKNLFNNETVDETMSNIGEMSGKLYEAFDQILKRIPSIFDEKQKFCETKNV